VLGKVRLGSSWETPLSTLCALRAGFTVVEQCREAAHPYVVDAFILFNELDLLEVGFGEEGQLSSNRGDEKWTGPQLSMIDVDLEPGVG
jgi:hypothetical protein